MVHSATVAHTLLGYTGAGSAIVECAFALANLPLTLEEIDTSPGSPTRERLLTYNPLGQVPVLLLADGLVLTESLAILHYVNDRAPQIGLIPNSGLEARAHFYRWAVFLVASIYPTLAFGDDPERWVDDPRAAESLRRSTDDYRSDLWRHVEAAAQAPFFLGNERSAIDLYLAVMTHWKPRRAWFEAEAPKLAAIARRVSGLPELAPVLNRHFPT